VTLSGDIPVIKAVTFDLWETLLLERNGWNLRRTNARCRSLAQALDKFGVRISVKQLELAFKKMASWLAKIWDIDDEVTHLDQIRFIIRTASEGSITPKEEWIEDLSSAYVSAIFEAPPYLNPDTLGILQWLKSKNKSIGLICNTGLTPGFGLRDFLIREDMATYFDLMLFSDEVGIRKPNPRIFQMAAEKLQVRPYEVVHVGDNLKSDVWGAKNAGFKAIHLMVESGRDRIAESDPTSLVSISRKLGKLRKDQIVPDKTITSITSVIKAVEELEFS
jgi:putative hydrolase of the HAD superfamily